MGARIKKLGDLDKKIGGPDFFEGDPGPQLLHFNHCSYSNKLIKYLAICKKFIFLQTKSMHGKLK